MEPRYYLCNECASNHKLHIKREHKVTWYSLFWYEGVYKNCILESKVIKQDYIGKIIKKVKYLDKYKKWLWIPAPSKRNHLDKSLKSLGVRYEKIFTKTKSFVQKEQNAKVRKLNSKYIIQTDIPSDTNIVLFDDTSTTGATINAMIDILGSEYNIIVVTFCTNQTLSI